LSAVTTKGLSQNNLSLLSILMSLVNASMDEKLLILLPSLENLNSPRSSSYFVTAPNDKGYIEIQIIFPHRQTHITINDAVDLVRFLPIF